MNHEAIYSLYPNVVLIDEAVGALDADNNIVEINETAVDAEAKRLQAEYESNQYQRDRAEQYPSIQDVVVALAEKEEGDDTMWQEITAKRQKVKADNPKPE